MYEEYEYGVQYYSTHAKEWRMVTTNHFHGWYPSQRSANNAIAQLRATSIWRWHEIEYRPVRRVVGAIEVVE